MKIKLGKCVQTLFFDKRGHFEISVFSVRIHRGDCMYILFPYKYYKCYIEIKILRYCLQKVFNGQVVSLL